MFITYYAKSAQHKTFKSRGFINADHSVQLHAVRFVLGVGVQQRLSAVVRGMLMSNVNQSINQSIFIVSQKL